jgi:NTE family protein
MAVPTDPILDQLLSMLSRSKLFPSVAPDQLRVLAEGCAWLSVPGGHTIFQEGSPSDAIFIIATGMLAAYQRDSDGREQLLGRMGSGEIVGEIGLITGDVRTATVKALRDSEVLRITNSDLRQVAFQSPALLLELCRTVVVRLKSSATRATMPQKSSTFVLVPHHQNVDINTLAAQLAKQSTSHRHALVVSKELTNGQSSDWMSQCEKEHNRLVYLAEATPTAWARACVRQADTIVLVAHGASAPSPFLALGTDEAPLTDVPVDLVLLWDGPIVPSKTIAWLSKIKPRSHFHIRTPADGERAARLLTGHALGLVLSGGGARGLAHLGVMRALHENGIAVDVVGGASVGAIVGAMLALEWNVQQATSAYVDEFLKWPHFSDFALSRQSLFSGRKARRLIDSWLGETTIEETPIQYYCVSTNLSNGTETVHRKGRLATYVRASFAVPGIFPPVLENGVVHVDGSVLNNLPTDPMRKLGVSRVIAVDLGCETAQSAQPDVPGLLELLWRVGSIGGAASQRAAHLQCDIVVTPDVRAVKFLDWRAYDQAIEAGYVATIKQLPSIQGLLAAK